MVYRDLREFLAQLEQDGELRRVMQPVSPHLEMTALCDRVLRVAGPALLFERPTGHVMPVLGNLFGTPGRIMRAMGLREPGEVRALGELLAALKEPVPPSGFKDMMGMGVMLKTCGRWRRGRCSVRRASNRCGRAPMSTSPACRCSIAGHWTSRLC
jgi:4-hydroxy-3-polyprenylbenzoate decarboxylase